MSKHTVDVYSWEKSQRNWIWVMEADIDTREVVDIKKSYTSERFGQLWEVKIFKASKNTYITLVLDDYGVYELTKN
jgi:hypothetical protein